MRRGAPPTTRFGAVALLLAGWAVLALAASVPAAESPGEAGPVRPEAVAAKVSIERLPPQFDVASWDVDSGLPQNTVRAVLQARDGHMWMGTSEGLARFNGSEFTVFGRRNTKDFPTAPITALAESPDGALWIATDGGGVARMQDGRITRYSTSGGLTGSRVAALAIGADGSVWIGTTSGLNRFKDGVLTSFTESEGLVRNTVRSLHRAASGEIWVGTSRGLTVIEGETLTTDRSIEPVSSLVIRALLQDAEGARWVATNSEVLRQHGGKTTRYTTKHGITPSTVEAIVQDRLGTVWLATSVGLYRFAGDGFVAQSLPGLGTREAIRTIFEDREGNLWLGTNAGVKRLRRTVFTAYGVEEGLPHDMIAAVCQDQAGALWVATMGGGLVRLEGGERTVFLKKHGLLSDNIRALHPTRDGALWVGFDRTGVARIEDGVATSYLATEEFAQSSAQALHEDRAGRLWIGMRNGLCHFHDGTFIDFTERAKIPGTIVRAFAEDADGTLWIGTNRGLTRYRDGEFTTFGEAEGLESASIQSLYFDDEGVLWIGTNEGGLNWMKDGRIHACTTANGLPSASVQGIVMDAQGHLWLATRQGIARVAKRQLEELAAGTRTRVDSVVFGKSDGLRGTEGSLVATPAAWRTNDGRLWFATLKSLATVDPERLHVNTEPPAVIVSRLVADGAAVAVDGEVALPAGEGELEFSYSALSYGQPERIQFRYRLEGVNQGWVNAGGRRVATYSRVPPGKRRFHVQAMSNGGEWGMPGATLPIAIAPHFYQTWWFYTAVAAVVCSAAFGGHKVRLRRLRKREQQLVALVRERTAHLESEINERKRAEEALKGSEALYHSLVEVLPMAIHRKDRDGRFTFANGPFCARLGRTFAEVVNRTDRELYPGAIAEAHETADRRVLETRQPVHAEETERDADGEVRWFDTLRVPVCDGAGEVVGTQGLSWDITPRKRAEKQVEQAHRELLEVSRLAGMAEVATGVLHNVGNVLNSVNVSATLVADRVRASKVSSLAKVSALLEQHGHDLADFMGRDQRGQAIPGYLAMLAEHLANDQTAVAEELEQLRKNIDHIKTIVAMQQSFAKVSGVIEAVALVDVVEDALRINGGALSRHAVELVRRYEAQPTVMTERHKVMQVLVNLIENAKHACVEARSEGKRIDVSIEQDGAIVRVTVKDNGVGIAPENLTRIFAHGFTTRKAGHGFGLHSSALVAKELGGRLFVRSEGQGHGAEFVLELPVAA